MKLNFYNAKKLKYLNTLNSGKPKRNSRGEITKDASFQSKDSPVGRIEPTRAWFTNTKTVTQNELEQYRSGIENRSSYDVLISTGNVPYSLINNEVRLRKKLNLDGCFGSKGHSKKPRHGYKTIEEMVNRAEPVEREAQESKNKIKGQSHRIWNELYKVIDSSDVIVHVLDARDPQGTRCTQIEEYIETKAKHKHLLYVLNKVDLVPRPVTAQWINLLTKKHLCIGCHSNSLDHNYGTMNLINVFRQLKKLYNKGTVSIGFVGYPNTGKSSLINALRNKKVCKSAPVPGETKCWQYVTLMKDLYLIDCPGVVPVADYKQAVLSGAIRVENVEDPDEFVPEVIARSGKQAVQDSYGIEFDGLDDFFVKMAKRLGKITKGGEPNIDVISKIVLHDFHRGKIPYFIKPATVQ